jgi:hypothetical protein
LAARRRRVGPAAGVERGGRGGRVRWGSGRTPAAWSSSRFSLVDAIKGGPNSPRISGWPYYLHVDDHHCILCAIARPQIESSLPTSSPAATDRTSTGPARSRSTWTPDESCKEAELVVLPLCHPHASLRELLLAVQGAATLGIRHCYRRRPLLLS